MTAGGSHDIDALFHALERVTPVQLRGRVKSVTGLLVLASLPEAFIGEVCLIYTGRRWGW